MRILRLLPLTLVLGAFVLGCSGDSRPPNPAPQKADIKSDVPDRVKKGVAVPEPFDPKEYEKFKKKE
jgi:hypothetical protein